LGASFPRCLVPLAAAPQRLPPKTRDVIAKCRDCLNIRRHGVIGEEARNDLPEPVPLFGNGQVPTPLQLLLGLPELCPQAVAPGYPLEEEFALARCAADKREAQKIEGLR